MAKDLTDTLEMISPHGAAHAQAERTLQILPHLASVQTKPHSCHLACQPEVGWKPPALAQLGEVSGDADCLARTGFLV